MEPKYWPTLVAVALALLFSVSAVAQVQPAPNAPCLTCCPDPPCEPILPPPGPRPAIRAAFYYPWWNGPTGSGSKWSQCQAFHYHPDYDGDGASELYYWNENVRDLQIGNMEYGHISAAVVSWWGVNSYENARFVDLLASAATQNFKVAIYYELEEYYDRTEAEVLSDIESVLNESWSNPALAPAVLAVSGRPVIFVYHPNKTSCSVVDKWEQVLNDLQSAGYVRPFVVLHYFGGGPSCASAAPADFTWHMYAPPGSGGYVLVSTSQGYQTNTIRPGFFPCSNSSPTEVRSMNSWTTNINQANFDRPKYFQLVTSFNEWLEMTSVEPATEWYSDSHHGQFIDALPARPPQ